MILELGWRETDRQEAKIERKEQRNIKERKKGKWSTEEKINKE
jgi:hypothetical protein